MKHYRFEEVRAALKKYWGLSLHRGGEMAFDDHDGRWDVCYSKTGFVVGGNIPGYGHGYRRYTSLSNVVRACELDRPIREARRASSP